MTTKLKLLKGGKVRGTGGGKGGGKGGGRRTSRPPSRPNPLNDLLWKATSHIYYKHRASSTEEIAGRMTRLSKRELGYEVNVSQKMATYLVADGRKRRLNYGWMLLNVEKGSIGFNRGYVPVLADVDDEDFELWLVEDTDLPYVIAGVQSAVHTEATMLEVSSDGMAFAAAAREAMGRPADDLRELAEDAHYLARRMRRLAVSSDAL